MTNLVYEGMPFVIPVLLATGRVGYLAKGEAGVQGSRVLLGWLAAFHSLQAVCVAEIFVSMIFIVIFGWEMRRVMNLSARAFVRSQSRSVLVTICSLGGPPCRYSISGSRQRIPCPPCWLPQSWVELDGSPACSW